MHCVNRIKCCGWIDDVTFLYQPGSLSPLMLMMLMRVDVGVRCIHGEIKDVMRVNFVFTTVKQS